MFDSEIIRAIGGLGLFLLGIRTMTEGLKGLAEKRLREVLLRAARTPIRGAVTGAITTAAVQSSSAVTVTAVAFAGAGLLTFQQTLGIIFGANIGTTFTGWLVALLGFKVKLGTISLLLVFVGAFLRLISRRRMVRHIGDAIAGFALVFLGIGFLQEGLASVAGSLSVPEGLGDTWPGIFLLVGFGILLTLLTQSSSATIAATVTALSTGIIDLPDALALAIGADVGTTGTALLATLGGTTASRRTGWAHVFYNLFTAGLALLALPYYLRAVGELAPNLTASDPEILTVLFHTLLNVVGTFIALPLARPFGWIVCRLVRERRPVLVRDLEARLLAEPRAALEALQMAVRRTSLATLDLFAHRLGVSIGDSNLVGALEEEELASVYEAVAECRKYLGRLVGEDLPADLAERALALVHVLDHAERLQERCRDGERATLVRDDEVFLEDRVRLENALAALREGLDRGPSDASTIDSIRRVAEELKEDHRGRRSALIARSVAGEIDPAHLDDHLDSLRWLRRSAGHAWKMAHYQKGL